MASPTATTGVVIVGWRWLLLVALATGSTACSGPPLADPPSPALPSVTPAPIKPSSTKPSASKPTEPPSDTPLARRISRLLSRVDVTERAPYHPGYDRSCDNGAACQFGEDWTDNHPGRFGHNGCTTREDVLLQQMKNVEMRTGSKCRIYEAGLVDPYTREAMTWRDDGYFIQIDHVYPLAEAWHAGAWDWPQKRRVRFANDVDRELLAVSGRANYDKGSGTPSEWLPPNKRFHCQYAVRYLTVADTYDLTITAADATTIRRVARRC